MRSLVQENLCNASGRGLGNVDQRGGRRGYQAPSSVAVEADIYSTGYDRATPFEERYLQAVARVAIPNGLGQN